MAHTSSNPNSPELVVAIATIVNHHIAQGIAPKVAVMIAESLTIPQAFRLAKKIRA